MPVVTVRSSDAPLAFQKYRVTQALHSLQLRMIRHPKRSPPTFSSATGSDEELSELSHPSGPYATA